MRQSIRTFGAGLLASAWLAQHYQMVYLHTVGETDINYAYGLAIRVMGPGPADVLGIGGYVIAVYLMLCLGAGLFLAGVAWPMLESALLELLALPARLWQVWVSRRDAPLSGNTSSTRQARKPPVFISPGMMS